MSDIDVTVQNDGLEVSVVGSDVEVSVGNKSGGWAIEYANVVDGVRVVQQVVGYFGGTGTPPVAYIGYYVADDGYTLTIGDATDIRGAEGGTTGGGSGDVTTNGSVAVGDLALFYDTSGDVIKAAASGDRANLRTFLQVHSQSEITTLLADYETIVDHNADLSDVAADIVAIEGDISTIESTLATKADLVGGVVPVAQLPAVAITNTFVVANQAAMLALTAQTGDIAIRTDLNKSFVLSTDSPGTLADWKELLTPTDAVLSVAGLTGAIAANDLIAALALEQADISGLVAALAAKQPLDDTLTDFAGLTIANHKVPVGSGADTFQVVDSTTYGRSLWNAADAAAAQTLLALVPGTNVQAYAATLAAVAGLTFATGKMIYGTGAGTAGLTDSTSFGRGILNWADAAAGIAALGAALDSDLDLVIGDIVDIQDDIAAIDSTLTAYDGRLDVLEAFRLLFPGGTTGQVLKKDSGTDYAFSWQDDATSGGGGGGGDVTGASNLGDGDGLFESEVTGVLRFKSLENGTGIVLTASSTEVEIAVNTTLAAIAGATPTAGDLYYWTSSSAISAIATSANVRSLLAAADYAAMRTLLGVQASDAQLDAIAGSTPTAGDLYYWTSATAISAIATSADARSLLALANYAAMRTAIGAQASDAQLDAIAGSTPTAGDLYYWTSATAISAISTSANSRALLAAANYAAMKALLDLEIGTDLQAWSAKLDAVTALTWAANKLIRLTGTGTLETIDITSDGASLIAAANYAAMRTALGAQASDAQLDAIAGSTPTAGDLYYWTSATAISAIATSANARSLLAAADYAAMRTLLSVQPADAQLDAWAGATPTAGDLYYWTSATAISAINTSANVRSILAAADYAAIRTLLSLQASDAQLDAIAGTTPSAGDIHYWTSSTAVSAIASSADGRALIAAADYAAMRTALGVQPADAQLDAWAGATPTAGDLYYWTSATAISAIATSANARSLLAAADYAAMRTLLGVQASDAQLDALAGVTPTAGDLYYWTSSTAISAIATTTDSRALLAAANYNAMRLLLSIDKVTSGQYRSNASDKVLTTTIVHSDNAWVALGQLTSPYTPDFSAWINATATTPSAGNLTFNNPTTGGIPGMVYTLEMTQHTTPRTITFGNQYKAAGGIANIVLTAVASRVDVLYFKCKSATEYWVSIEKDMKVS